MLCLEKQYLSSWHGASRDRSAADDYASACAIKDFCALLDIKGVSALIFGDMPLAAAAINSLDGLLIVRPIFASNIDEEIECIRSSNMRPTAQSETSPWFHVERGGMVMFDSAYSGDSYRESIEFALDPGCYRARSWIYTPNEETSLIVHKLEKASQ